MKRQRGRGRKPGGGGGGNHGNRPLESNGPEVKIRGTAAQIYEKYMQYARDAQSSGDRVKYENYLQHAEHYFRIMMLTMPRDRLLQQQEGGGMPMQAQQSGEGGQPQPADGNVAAGSEGGGAPADPMKVMDDQSDDDGDYDSEEGGEEAGAEGGEEVAASDQDSREDGQVSSQNGERHGRRRRRGRRNRHHDGDRGPGGEGGPGGSALDSLARKQGALAGG